MSEERKRGAVPTEVDPDENSVMMSYHFVARDGKTYASRTWVWPGGSTYSYSEPASQNVGDQPRADDGLPPKK